MKYDLTKRKDRIDAYAETIQALPDEYLFNMFEWMANGHPFFVGPRSRLAVFDDAKSP